MSVMRRRTNTMPEKVLVKWVPMETGDKWTRT